MLKRGFGCLALLMGASLAGFIIYYAVSGKGSELRGFLFVRSMILPAVLIAFGFTWMRGGTFGSRR